MKYLGNILKIKQIFKVLLRTICLCLLTNLFLISCSNENVKPDAASANGIAISPVGTDVPTSTSSVLINPCELLDQQIYQEIFADSTLIINFEKGSCWISNQWDTKSIQLGVFQDDQAGEAVRWYSSQLVAGWNKPDLIAFVNQLLIDGSEMSVSDFQQLMVPFYERIDYRSERIFSIGDTTFWYIYPLASANILDLSVNNIYLRISMSGFFAEQALPISLDLADRILKQVPNKFHVDYQFETPTALGYSTPTGVADETIPAINLITLDHENIFFGDLCGDEITTITALIEEKDNVENVYIVYRLISDQEVNTNWVTRPMERVENGKWEISLSAENDFSAYKLVSGAKVEYAVSIIYNISEIYRSPTYNNLQLNQCILKN